MTEHQRGPFYTRRDDALAIARREKALAVMIHERGRAVERPRGHREWIIPLAERKYHG